MRETIQLSERGFSVDVTHSAPEAFSKLLADKDKYQILCVDLYMQGKTGTQLLRDLKDQIPATQLRRVVIRSNASQITEEDVLALGSPTFIEKPFVIHYFIEVCQKLFADKYVMTHRYEKSGLSNSVALRILVAEDNEVNQIVIKGILERLGHSVDITANGRLCLDRLQENPIYDLIFMDCEMPVLNGFEATIAIRDWEQQHGRAPIPIIALTAHVISEQTEHCIRVGINTVLTKPVSITKVHETLESLSANKTST